MPDSPPSTKGRGRRVRKNLRQGMGLAWAASPSSLIRYSILGMLSAAMPPIAVYLGAALVNRIAEARLHSLRFTDLVPILVGSGALGQHRDGDADGGIARQPALGAGGSRASGGWTFAGARAPRDLAS